MHEQVIKRQVDFADADFFTKADDNIFQLMINFFGIIFFPKFRVNPKIP